MKTNWTVFLCISRYLLCLTACIAQTGHAQTEPDQLARAIHKELVEIDTTTATGDTLFAARAMAARLKAAGFAELDVKVLSPAPHKGNLVARLHGTNMRKPMLLMAHLDVVPAKREDWNTDPFKLVEKDGYIYGRGVFDDKFMASVWVATLIRFKQEGYVPDRDIILVLETDEEILDANDQGIRWLLKNHRDLIDAEFAINEGANVNVRNGKVLSNNVQTSEKVSYNFSLEVKNKGGHSSLPTRDNAIYRLADALARLSRFSFPVNLNETTRGYFAKTAQLETGQIAVDMTAVAAAQPDLAAAERLSASPLFNALLHTTCVATMLEGGQAVNALPQSALAKINCRMLPTEKVADIEATINRVLNDSQIKVTLISKPTLSEPSPLNKELLNAITATSKAFWPAAPIIPYMGTGATDGAALRNAGIPTYGHSGLAVDIDDMRMHGNDERVSTKAFSDGREYLYRLVKVLSSKN
ncbi:acetylornithine deacetylase/succinyl-diaminopimelate desuccinylase-like protein [Oxalobacteraceae bacterium GrIS 2.11]